MNYTLIVLGVILCVIIFMMFKFISDRGKVVTNIITLDSSTVNPIVQYSSLSTPASSRYYLSFWLNVNSIPASTDIFTITDTAASATDGASLVVKITNTSELKYTIKENNVGKSSTDHSILTNFPLQKWVYVILSVDGQIVDIYIDGKMIRSEKLASLPITPTKTAVITFPKPTSGLMYIAKFERHPTAIDPSTAWSNYMTGNGGNYFSNLFSGYGATFSLTENNLEIKRLSLF